MSKQWCVKLTMLRALTKKSKDRFADTNIQTHKVEVWFAPITGSENLIFCASPGKYKAIIPLLFCHPLLFSFHPPTPPHVLPPVFFPSDIVEQSNICATSLQVYLHICILLLFLEQFYSRSSDTQCLTVEREILRLVYKSLKGLASRYIADLLV